AVDEEGDEEGVDGGHGGRLGRREDAAVDAADDDDDEEQAPGGVEPGIEGLAEAAPGLRRQAVHPRGNVDADHQHDAGEQSGDDAGDEHAADRDVGGRGVDHHDDRRRDEDAEGAGVADDAG